MSACVHNLFLKYIIPGFSALVKFLLIFVLVLVCHGWLSPFIALSRALAAV